METELFSQYPSTVGELIQKVETGEIGLPTLQRPFVWTDTQVRELLDSMMKGYPIGYIMLWDSPEGFESANQIGLGNKSRAPKTLLIDGQQRLTALLAAFRNTKVLDGKYRERSITICYNPFTKEFAVWTPAYERNKAWISNIGEVFKADADHKIPKFRKSFIKGFNESREKNGEPDLTDDEEELLEQNINALLDLLKFSLPIVDIKPRASEEDVAEIFVRVNSGGQKLNQNDFIETLLAVYNNELHKKIGDFCAESHKPAKGTSFNQIMALNSTHLIRMIVGVGFRRARLRYAYLLLRGKNLETGKVTKDEMKKNLQKFESALEKVTDLRHWHDFTNEVSNAGYINGDLISSGYVIIFSYVLYLIGYYDYKVRPLDLKKLIKQWVFMAAITGFYTTSAESTVERQFADLKNIHDANGYITYLKDTIDRRLSEEFFNVTLPKAMEGSAASSPNWYGYLAAQNVLGIQTLFGTTTVASLLSVGADSDKKKAVERHHIFPKHYLEGIGFDDDRDRNQNANFAYLDYATNIDIGDKAPMEYVAAYRAKLGEDGYRKTCADNALPENFENMSYLDFLRERRILMAGIVKRAYLKLCE